MRRPGYSRSAAADAAVFLFVLLFGTLCGVGTLSSQDADISLRRGFREILLGTPFEEVERAIIADSAFAYRGQPDLSLALSDSEPLIDTRGRRFVDRGVFSFHQGRLFSIALYLSARYLDYFQLYDQLQTRYGAPGDLDPQRAVWDDGVTRIELERPLTIRYLDLEAFEERRRNTRTLEAIEDVSRQEFLEEF